MQNIGKINPAQKTYNGFPRVRKRQRVQNIYYVTPPPNQEPDKSNCGCGSKKGIAHKVIMIVMGLLSLYALYCLFGGKK